MIEAISRRVQRENLKNVRTVLGTATDPNLPRGLDAVLIVDAYHEMDDPARPESSSRCSGTSRAALKPQGRVGVVDFTPGRRRSGPGRRERVDPER